MTGAVTDELAPEVLDALSGVADRFALGTVRSAGGVARGAMGEVHRVVTDSGAYAVKRAFWREDPDAVVEARARFEVDFADRCREAGVASPRAVVDPHGTVVVRDGSGTAWRVHELVAGVVPDRSDRAAQRWVLERGALIHRLALEPMPGDTVHEFYRVSSVDWHGLADRADDARVDWGGELRSRAAEFAELGEWATSVPLRPVVLCHRDLKANNTLVEPDGTRWLLDWDDVGAHDPAREVGTVLLHHVPDEAALGSLAAAYGAAGGVELPEGAELFASGVAVWLNFLAGQVGVLLDPTSEPGHRAFALPKVRGLLEDVPAYDVLVRCGRLAGRAANRGQVRAPLTMGP